MTPSDVIIIGAPRSGTNMLRDVLSALPGVVTWPCDEVNGIWRHGSLDYPTDEIPVSRATERQCRFVATRFERVRRRLRGETVVEKTCANSLRVDYVAALRPDAKFVLITRDGVDATASAMARWHAPVDWRYTARKARFVPAADLARTTARFAVGRLRKRAHHDGRMGSWGPRFEGIDAMLRDRSLEEVCAAQWQQCVEQSHRALERLPTSQVFRLTYEEFVSAPVAGLSQVLRFLELPEIGAASAVAEVSPTSVGKGRSSLDAGQLERVEHLLRPTLERLSYA